MSTPEWVGRAVREARERRGWTQADLARELGRTQTSVSYWESGKRSPGLDDLLELADVLGVEVEELIPSTAGRRPAAAVLRATADRIDYSQLLTAVDELLEEADRVPIPTRELRPSSTQPAYAANELIETVNTRRPPVDVVGLARRCGALVIERSFPDDLSGLVFTHGQGAVIGVNANHPPTRRRFTVAHELGHIVLGHAERQSGEQRVMVDIAQATPPGYDWRAERAANDFAADLLMPRRLVVEAFHHQQATAQLARTFEVSELAMGYRLMNLGLR